MPCSPPSPGPTWSWRPWHRAKSSTCSATTCGGLAGFDHRVGDHAVPTAPELGQTERALLGRLLGGDSSRRGRRRRCTCPGGPPTAGSPRRASGSWRRDHGRSARARRQGRAAPRRRRTNRPGHRSWRPQRPRWRKCANAARRGQPLLPRLPSLASQQRSPSSQPVSLTRGCPSGGQGGAGKQGMH